VTPDAVLGARRSVVPRGCSVSSGEVVGDGVGGMTVQRVETHTSQAEPAEEVEVAERVPDKQGWEAWPVCSEVVE
jgi:tetrahydrodipicolinate N-succinyltransferase